MLEIWICKQLLFLTSLVRSLRLVALQQKVTKGVLTPHIYKRKLNIFSMIQVMQGLEVHSFAHSVTFWFLDEQGMVKNE